MLTLCDIQKPADTVECTAPLPGLTFEMDSPRDSKLLARQVELYQELARLSADNEGIAALAHALARHSNKGVLIQDKRLQPLASVPSPELAHWTQVVDALGAHSYLPAELVDRKRAVLVRAPVAQSFESCARLVMPIIAQRVARGYLSLIQPSDQFDEMDRVIIEQGALICAVEMAKVKAVSVAEKKLRGDLVEAILSGSIGESDAARWADRAGFRRTGPYVAIALQWIGREAPSLRRLETLVNGQIKRHRSRALALARESDVLVLYALSAERGVEDARQWAQTVQNLAGLEDPQAQVAIGIGRPAHSLLPLRDSCREATQAMAIEHRLHHGKPQYYADLGVYRLLLPLSATPELRAFALEVLGPLLEYDRDDKTNLLETLRVYFRFRGNVVQTARELYIHRNTLLYRLERICQVTGLDLDDAETRLKLQLALRAHELTRNEVE